MNTIASLAIAAALWCFISEADGLSAKSTNQSTPTATRRTFLTQVGQVSAAVVTVSVGEGRNSIAKAATYGEGLFDGVNAFDSPERRSLLESIASRSSDDVVADAINR